MVVNACTFDVLIACLFTIVLVVVARHVLWRNLNFHDFFTLGSRKTSYESFSLDAAYQSYSNYRHLATLEISNRRTTYNTLGRSHKRLGNTIGYPEKLAKLKLMTDMNAVITEKIAGLAAVEFGLRKPGAGNGDIWRVRESLKHFIRDWSTCGAAERESIHKPILDILRVVDENGRSGKHVLVPGSGLGRLAWEISQLGYDTTANELSFYMNLAFRFLLSPETTTTTNEHTLHPYVHWFSHQRSNASLFRAIHFPDAIPRLSPTFRLVEADFLTLKAPSANPPKFVWSKTDPVRHEAQYDYIITLFFIDTSSNVLATMEHVYTLLRPGGTWINLGPLLWDAENVRVELSLDEVVRAAQEIGFVVHDGDPTIGDLFARRTVECEYTYDTSAMIRSTYKAEFWVATKPK